MKILITSTSFQDTPGKHKELIENSGFEIDTLSDLDRVVMEMKDDSILNKTKYNKI